MGDRFLDGSSKIVYEGVFPTAGSAYLIMIVVIVPAALVVGVLLMRK